MEILVPKYRRNPNEKIVSLYHGVASRGRTMVSMIKPSLDRNHLIVERSYGAGLPRGQGGRVAVLVLGGMETTLDEMEYILEAKRRQKFAPLRKGGEIADMCRMLIERRNARIRYFRKNPSEKPKKRTMRLYLPSGYKFVNTPEPGLQVAVRA